MWLFELIGVALVAGVVVGVAWRVVEGYFEKREWQNALKQADENLTEATVPATTEVTAQAASTANKTE